ncbi:MAG: hypothetical protein PF569_01280 [Candidatus Woesearchaeota archaeon]|jgi:hypothetical protein|nr:hypothetical protein [Candidatus Woesearchaeota archaeon]
MNCKDVVICNNHECDNWKHENDYMSWGDNKLELDKTLREYGKNE